MAAPRVERSLRLPSLGTLKVASATDAEHPARLAALALRSRSPQVLDALAECAGAGPAGLARARGFLHAGTVPDAMLTRATGPHSPPRSPGSNPRVRTPGSRSFWPPP